MCQEYSLARDMRLSLTYYSQFLKLQWDKNNITDPKAFMDRLEFDFLNGAKKRGQKARKLNTLKRSKLDSQRIDNLPPNEIIKDVLNQAMVDLHKLCTMCQTSSDMGHKEKIIANTCLIGILFLNGFAGRSGEWQSMLAEHVQEQMSQGLDFVICPVHKTSDSYGELAKWLAPGTMEAIKMYLSLPGKQGVYFLEHASQPGKMVSISFYLSRFGATYCSYHYVI